MLLFHTNFFSLLFLTVPTENVSFVFFSPRFLFLLDNIQSTFPTVSVNNCATLKSL